jgi:uncharacterized protein (DUF4415 family)
MALIQRQGKGCQTRMNAVLRSYMLAQRRQEHRRDTH